MSGRARVVEINCRRPANPVQAWDGRLVSGGVLSVAGKGGDAASRNGGVWRVITLGPHQNDQGENRG